MVALLPNSWLAALQDVTDIVNFPLTPLRDGAARLAGWLRPSEGTFEPGVTDESLDSIYQEKEIWRQRYRAAELRIRELEEQLEQIQQLPVSRFAVPVTPMQATITAQNARSPQREAELNRGARAGVTVGSIAVIDGVHLIGRVTEVSAVRSVLVPIVSPASGFMLARVLSAERPDLPVDEAPVIQLTATGDDTFTADADQNEVIAEGDTVILADSAWPQTAQAMIIGIVSSVTRKDEQPLRNEIVVRPRHLLHRLSSVTLVIERRDRTTDRPAEDQP